MENGIFVFVWKIHANNIVWFTDTQQGLCIKNTIYYEYNECKYLDAAHTLKIMFFSKTEHIFIKYSYQ